MIGPITWVATERIQRRVGDIDRTIRQIRTSIFELRGPLDGVGGRDPRSASWRSPLI